MNKKEIKIIEEFLKATPKWLKNMEWIEKKTGRKMCVICGMQPHKIKELAEAVKKIFTP